MKTIFLTGATGFVGSYLTYEFLKQGYALKLLIRDKKISAEERLEKSLSYLIKEPGEYTKLKDNFEIIHGDITCDNLGIKPRIHKRLQSEVDIVFHNAALTSFEESKSGELKRNNLKGTRNVLDFTLKLKNPEFHYMSTAYICGQNNGVFSEDDLDAGQSFNNPYEESKFRAEKLINKYRERFFLKTAVYRPSIIVGDSKTGKTSNFLGVYSFIKAIYFLADIFSGDLKRDGKRALTAGVSCKNDRLHIPLRIPADSDKTLNIVPIDYVVAVVVMNLKNSADFNTYHIVNPSPPTLGELNNIICSTFNLTGIKIADQDEFKTKPMTEWERFFIGSINDVTPYLQRKEPVFSDMNTQKILKNTKIRCPKITKEIVTKLVSYYINHSGLKK
ncbi:SDR family oxidoreductase [Candidatus Roizmanbacteria bacterium]|nr:SDR family oxidoreductase [Candidatus Roizmanbacteria bacterium]